MGYSVIVVGGHGFDDLPAAARVHEKRFKSHPLLQQSVRFGSWVAICFRGLERRGPQRLPSVCVLLLVLFVVSHSSVRGRLNVALPPLRFRIPWLVRVATLSSLKPVASALSTLSRISHSTQATATATVQVICRVALYIVAPDDPLVMFVLCWGAQLSLCTTSETLTRPRVDHSS